MGEGNLMDPGLLASAVGRPQQFVFGEEAYPAICEKVAALFESLILNHAFLDGNKRTAVVAAIHMLNWNDLDLVADQSQIIDIALDVVSHTADLQKLAEFFEAHSVPIDFVIDDEWS